MIFNLYIHAFNSIHFYVKSNYDMNQEEITIKTY